jgi:hypothetical protein
MSNAEVGNRSMQIIETIVANELGQRLGNALPRARILVGRLHRVDESCRPNPERDTSMTHPFFVTRHGSIAFIA